MEDDDDDSPEAIIALAEKVLKQVFEFTQFTHDNFFLIIQQASSNNLLNNMYMKRNQSRYIKLNSYFP
jgi:hypothetical protein